MSNDRDMSIGAILARQERARREVSALCQGQRWIMSIQAREDEDSDLVISGALRDARILFDQRNELMDALGDLVRACEERNAAISTITGRPLDWKAKYLDEARAVYLDEARAVLTKIRTIDEGDAA